MKLPFTLPCGALRKSANALRSLLLLAASCLLVISCGENDSQTKKSTDNSQLRVITTFTVIADMARNVAGDSATVLSVTKPGAEIHNYQPTPKDISQADGVDLVLWNGLGLELWFEKFLQQLNDVPSAVVTDNIEPIDIGTGPYTGKPNPHAWMSPDDALVYVDNIARALSDADPDNSSAYGENASRYKDEITAVATPLRQAIDAIPQEDRWLVSSEGAFSYLARDYGLKELYIWPINADQQGTPLQVKNVIDTVREHSIPVVFSESTVSPKAAQQIARESGARYAGILYVDSLSAADGPVPTYLDLLRVTTETIAKGLTAATETKE